MTILLSFTTILTISIRIYMMYIRANTTLPIPTRVTTDDGKGVKNKSYIQVFGLTITDNQVKTGIASYCQPIVERLLTLGFLR